jgi:hypothetical protein
MKTQLRGSRGDEALISFFRRLMALKKLEPRHLGCYEEGGSR